MPRPSTLFRAGCGKGFMKLQFDATCCDLRSTARRFYGGKDREKLEG